jgi:hypothetical protein
MMSIKSLIVIIMIFAASCAHQNCGHPRLMSQYKDSLDQMGQQLALSSNDLDLGALDRLAQNLTDAGTTLLMDFKQRHPSCRALMEKIISEQGMMLTISLEELERRYHEGEDLPPSPEYCFHAKELIVHPQTIRSLIRDQRQNAVDHRQTILDEHIELSTHFEMFETDFNRKG